jgi:uncharacterized membrane protein YqjE
MAATVPPAGGILDSLRRICDTGLALVQNRVELFGVELEEQKSQLLKAFVLAGSIIFLVNLAALMVALTIVVAVGESARVPVLIGLSALFLVAAGVAFFWLRRELQSGPPPFQQTLNELEQDRNWLKTRK